MIVGQETIVPCCWSPKTQSAMLEAMQERQVTVAGKSRPLPDPFLVVATRNPIEQEGAYPLPEAQPDRFMFSLHPDYPVKSEEVEIVKRTTLKELPALTPTVSLARSSVLNGNHVVIVRQLRYSAPAVTVKFENLEREIHADQ